MTPMPRLVRVLSALVLLLAACSSSGDGTTTTLDPDAAPATAADGDPVVDETPDPNGSTPDGSTPDAPADGPGSTVDDADEPTGDTTSTSPPEGSTTTEPDSTTVPPTPTTLPTATIPTEGSTPVTDDTTPSGGTGTGRPDDALDVTVTSSQLFVIGGDTLYLVVEGEKAECHVLGYEVVVDGGDILIDLWSVDDPGCSFPTDYKDSLALGTYGPGSYTIFLLDNDVADVDL